MKFLMVLGLAGLIAIGTAAQSLSIEDTQAGGDPVRISSVAIDATILGGQSITRMELVVTNPASRVRGGNLTVPLPVDATLIGYQLEVNGVLVDGVPVPKPRATEVYETILKRGTDPGLVEQAQGNAFKTRVFPINAGQSRRVVLRWSANLSGSKADLYRLPLKFAAPVADFKLKLSVLDIKQAPRLAVKGLDGANFAAWESGFQTMLSRKNIVLDTTLELALPESGLNKVLVEAMGREHWFAVLLPVPPAAGGASGESAARAAWAKAANPAITLYLDASYSRRNADAAPLAAILAKTAGLLGKNLSVDLVVFRDVPEPVKRMLVKPDEARELARALELVDYDGGSRFDNLPAPAKASLALVFSDALPTLGELLPSWKQADTVVLTSGSLLDAGAAARLAGAEGQVLSLEDPDGKVTGRDAVLAKTLVSQNASPQLKLLTGEAKNLRLVHPNGDREHLLLAGQLVGSQIEVAWGSGNTAQRIKINDDELRDGELARFAWAGAELQAMQLEPDYGSPAWKERLSQFGMNYGVVTPGTSLLVLETLAQYLEFDIKPPASLPEWEQAWRQQVSKKASDEKSARESRIRDLATQWKERIDWWNRDFSKVPDKLAEPAKDKKGAEMPQAGLALRDNAPAPAMAAPRSEAMDQLSSDEREMAKSSPAKEDSLGGLAGAGREATMEVKAWDPDRPYLKELKSVGPDLAYQRYLKIRDAYTKSPAFFIEVGDWFVRNGKKELAWRIWTTLGDLGFKDNTMQRILAQRLAQAGDAELAVVLFTLVRDDRPFEPQSHRDLALALAQAGRYKEAVPLLYQVATGQWNRTQGIEILALMEFNRYYPLALKQGLSTVGYDSRLIKLLDCDLRIIMSWDADNTDQDLWVTEPSGFRVSYSATNSPHGGHISNDITDGYGPEEYLIHQARKGSYRIETNFFGSRSPELTGAATLFVTIFTNYGRSNEKQQSLTLQLEGSGDTFLIGSASW